jgi:hypothetical protein
MIIELDFSNMQRLRFQRPDTLTLHVAGQHRIRFPDCRFSEFLIAQGAYTVNVYNLIK